MHFHCSHYIRVAMILAPALALAGCWEKIEYTGSSPSSASERPSASDSAATATLPESKKTELPRASVQSTPSSVDQTSPTQSASDDRYRSTTPTAITATESSTPVPPKPLKHDADDDRYAIAHPPVEISQITKPAPPAAAPGIKAEAEPQPPVRHTDATPTSATVDVKQTPNLLNVRRAAWLLGDRLSFAALAHDRGLALESVPRWFDEAQSAAKAFGTSVDA